jgi:hypothetical protein
MCHVEPLLGDDLEMGNEQQRNGVFCTVRVDVISRTISDSWLVEWSEVDRVLLRFIPYKPLQFEAGS